MGRMVIAAYKPHPGQEEALEELVRDHLPILRRLGLATDRPALAMRAGDGTIVEVFEWMSEEAVAAAHQNPDVRALWERFGALCECVPS